MPGERELPDFLPPRFLLDADEADFFAADRFFVLFLVAIRSLLSSDVNDFRSPGPPSRPNRKGCAATTKRAKTTSRI